MGVFQKVDFTRPKGDGFLLGVNLVWDFVTGYAGPFKTEQGMPSPFTTEQICMCVGGQKNWKKSDSPPTQRDWKANGNAKRCSRWLWVLLMHLLGCLFGLCHWAGEEVSEKSRGKRKEHLLSFQRTARKSNSESSKTWMGHNVRAVATSQHIFFESVPPYFVQFPQMLLSREMGGECNVYVSGR